MPPRNPPLCPFYLAANPSLPLPALSIPNHQSKVFTMEAIYFKTDTSRFFLHSGISLSERRKCEFDFSILNTWKSGDVLGTTVIADALEKFGGFPRRYYVRLEETMVFQNCLNSLKKESKLRALILGSPGVGKSVFLVLFAFYLAHVESKSVIILRKLKEVGPGVYACVHVSKKGSSGSRLYDLAAYPGIRSSLLSDGSNLE